MIRFSFRRQEGLPYHNPRSPLCPQCTISTWYDPLVSSTTWQSLSKLCLIPPAGSCFSSKYQRSVGGGRASDTRQRRVSEAPATTSTTEPSLWPTRLMLLGGTAARKEDTIQCEMAYSICRWDLAVIETTRAISPEDQTVHGEQLSNHTSPPLIKAISSSIFNAILTHDSEVSRCPDRRVGKRRPHLALVLPCI